MRLTGGCAQRKVGGRIPIRVGGDGASWRTGQDDESALVYKVSLFCIYRCATHLTIGARNLSVSESLVSFGKPSVVTVSRF